MLWMGVPGHSGWAVNGEPPGAAVLSGVGESAWICEDVGEL